MMMEDGWPIPNLIFVIQRTIIKLPKLFSMTVIFHALNLRASSIFKFTLSCALEFSGDYEL